MGKIMLNGISYGSLTSSPHMIKHGDLSLYQALKFLENKIIIGSGTPNSSMGRNGDLYISYDSAPPENGGDEPETTVNHFNTALSLVGLGAANSITDVLTNSDSCTALAANSAACSIMKEHYSADMTSMIENNFNEGLNLLNYRCQLTCFLCKGKSLCTNITGGYDRAVYHASNASDAPSGNNGSYIYAHATWLGVGSSYLTKNAIDTTGYTKAEAYGRTYGEADSQYVLCGIAHKNSDGNDLTATLKGFPFPAYTSTWSKQTTTSFGTNGYWGVYVRAIGVKYQETGYAEAQYIKLIP